jgi:hypothetical protein
LMVIPQESKFQLKTGAGYYTDMLGWYDGPVVWLEGGVKLNTGFYLNTRVSVASIDWKINDGYFKDYKTILLRQMLDVTFSRPVNLSGGHFIEPGVGFKLKREYSLNPDVTIENISGQNYLFANYSKVFWEIGFTVCFDYYYRFKSGFFLGLRTDTNIIWALGFEGLTISPLFGFRF